MPCRDTMQGYLVDLDSFRAESGDPLTRARAHGKERLLAGGAYGLVTDQGRLVELIGAPRGVVEGAVRANPHQCGIRVEIEREERGGRMVTTAVYTTEALPSSMAGGRHGRGWNPWRGQEG